MTVADTLPLMATVMLASFPGSLGGLHYNS